MQHSDGVKTYLPNCVSKVSHIHLLIVLSRHWWAGLCSIFILNFVPGWKNIGKQKKRLNYFSALFKKYLIEFRSIFYSTLRNLSGFPKGGPLSALSFSLYLSGSIWTQHCNRKIWLRVSLKKWLNKYLIPAHTLKILYFFGFWIFCLFSTCLVAMKTMCQS